MTENKKNSNKLYKCFDKELIPLSETLKSKGIRLLETDCYTDSGSYYKQRDKRKAEPADFEWSCITTAEELEQALAELWSSQGLDELVPLTTALGKLAEELKLQDTQDADVSQFIYAMH